MEPRKTLGWIVLGFVFVLLALTGLVNKASGESSGHDIAIRGYDCVAYFTNGKAIQGNPAIVYDWHDLTWYFASKENKELFAENPKKYAPQYDGYCAWAMTESRKAHTDPEVWKIVKGKLYLNCSRTAYEKWIRNIPGNIEKANKNWLKMREQK